MTAPDIFVSKIMGLEQIKPIKASDPRWDGHEFEVEVRQVYIKRMAAQGKVVSVT